MSLAYYSKESRLEISPQGREFLEKLYSQNDIDSADQSLEALNVRRKVLDTLIGNTITEFDDIEAAQELLPHEEKSALINIISDDQALLKQGYLQ